MNSPATPVRERRRHRRICPPNVRVRCSSGQFDDVGGGVNFSKRLVNLSPAGLCIETTGRLRPEVRMNVEVRFDDFGGTLRGPAQIVWAETVQKGGVEMHLTGLRLIGPEMTAPVREFFEGGRPTMIAAQRQVEYRDLKQKSEDRKAGRFKKWSASKKSVSLVLVLLFVYVASFGGFVQAGRRDAPGPGIHFRFPGPPSTDEGILEKIYSPLLWSLRKAGLDVTVDRP
jgi:hypothetical protein